MKIFQFCLFALALSSQVLSQGWTLLTDPGSSPSPRYFYSSAVRAETQEFLLFGGVLAHNNGYANDLYRFSFSNLTWSLISPSSGVVPNARNGQTSVIDPVSGDFFVFGGYLGSSEYSNDLWRFSFDSNVWKQIQNPTGSIPSPRAFFSSAIEPLSGDLLVFGGDSLFGDFFNDFYRYSFTGNNWTQINSSTGPSERSGHSSQIEPTSGDFLVYGGAVLNSYFGDLWAFSFNTSQWVQINDGYDYAPAPRNYMSTGIDMFNGNLLVFGGSDENDNFNDFWSYSFESNEWNTIHSDDNVPSARYIGAGGGIDSIDGSFLIFAGYDSGATLNDTWLYNFNVPISTTSAPTFTTSSSVMPSPGNASSTYSYTVSSIYSTNTAANTASSLKLAKSALIYAGMGILVLLIAEIL